MKRSVLVLLAACACALGGACDGPAEPPADAVVVGRVYIGSRPLVLDSVRVQVTACRAPGNPLYPYDHASCTGVPDAWTDGSGRFRIEDLRVGWTYTVEVVESTAPEGVELHPPHARSVTVPKSRVARVNFYGSCVKPVYVLYHGSCTRA